MLDLFLESRASPPPDGSSSPVKAYAHSPAAQTPANRPPTPVRDPRTPGYVTATDATELADGAVPPGHGDWQFHPWPDASAGERHDGASGGAPGTVHTFTMNSTDSKIYPGIARAEGTRAVVYSSDPAKRIVNSGPAPYKRTVAVYVPQQYVPGTVAPFIVGADGPD